MRKFTRILLFLIIPAQLYAGLPLTDEPPSSEENEASQKAETLWGPLNGKIVLLNLQECLDRSLTKNRELEAASYDIRTAEEKLSEVRKVGYPILDYEYTVGPAPKDVSHAIDSFFSGDLTVFNKLKIGLGVPLETFGKVGTGREMATLGIEVEKEKREQKKTEVAFKVNQLFYGIQLAREIRRLLKSARDGLTKEIGEREKREGGNPSELLKLKLFNAELERRIETGGKKEIMALEALRILISIDRTARFDITPSRLRPVLKNLTPFESYRDSAISGRQDLKQLRIAVDLREKKMVLEKRLTRPNLGLGAFFEMGRTPNVTGITTTDDFSDPLNFTRAGVGLRLEGKFDFHGTAAKLRQARSEFYKTRIQKELATEGVLLEVKESYLDVKNAKEEMERAEEAGKLSRQLLFLTQSNVDIGLAEGKDLVDALQSFLETRGKYFEAIFNYNVALAKLEQKIGRIPQ